MRKVTEREEAHVFGGMIAGPGEGSGGGYGGGSTGGDGAGAGGLCISQDQAQAVMNWANSPAVKIAFGATGAALGAWLTDGASLSAPATAAITQASGGVSAYLSSDVASAVAGDAMDAWNELLDAAEYIEQEVNIASWGNPGSYYAQDYLTSGYYQWACSDLNSSDGTSGSY